MDGKERAIRAIEFDAPDSSWEHGEILSWWRRKRN